VTRAISGHVPRWRLRFCRTNSRSDPSTMTGTLADNRYNCKRYAANEVLRHGKPVGKSRKPRQPKEPKSWLHALFIRRLHEELKARDLNPNRLHELGAKQRTVADALRGSDPRLSTILKVAQAMGMASPADLLREGKQHRSGEVVTLKRQAAMLDQGNLTSTDRKKRQQ